MFIIKNLSRYIEAIVQTYNRLRQEFIVGCNNLYIKFDLLNSWIDSWLIKLSILKNLT